MILEIFVGYIASFYLKLKKWKSYKERQEIIDFIFSEKSLGEVRNTSPFFAWKKGVGGVGGSYGGGGMGVSWFSKGTEMGSVVADRLLRWNLN